MDLRRWRCCDAGDTASGFTSREGCQRGSVGACVGAGHPSACRFPERQKWGNQGPQVRRHHGGRLARDRPGRARCVTPSAITRCHPASGTTSLPVSQPPTRPIPLAGAVGDFVVRASSATGRRHLKPTNVAVLGGVRHLDLPRDPRCRRTRHGLAHGRGFLGVRHDLQRQHVTPFSCRGRARRR